MEMEMESGCVVSLFDGVFFFVCKYIFTFYNVRGDTTGEDDSSK
jgi:hypothetical protein